MARIPTEYHVQILGEPGTKLWGWKVAGHHLFLTATVADGHIVSLAPSMLGAAPTVPDLLQEGAKLARQLAASFTASQRAVAFGSRQVGASHFASGQLAKASSVEPKGLPASDMDAAQQVQFRELIAKSLEHFTGDARAAAEAEIAALDLAEMTFLWAGDVSDSSRDYFYVIQAPNFLVETSGFPDDMFGGEIVDHVHTVFRDIHNDFGSLNLLAHHHDHYHSERP